MRKFLIISSSFFIFVFLIFIFFIFLSGANKVKKEIKSEVPESSFVESEIISPTSSFPTLHQVIGNSFIDDEGIYAIVVKNFKTGESYFLNEDRIFEPASLYKLWILATLFRILEKGDLNEDDVLSQDVAVLNEKFHIASDSAELTEGSITLRVGEAAENMITISDNYSALLLSEKIRLSTVKNFLEENGFFHSFLGEPPTTTAYDIALFFEKLYMGKLAGAEGTNKMVDILRRQRINGKLPKYLPPGTIIAHKTGELGNFSHDAGIVFTSEGDYIIVVLSESSDPTKADEQIARISQAVYNYFVKKEI